MSIKSMTGLKFGRLLVVAPTDKRVQGSVMWLCQCSCGNQCVVKGSSLRREERISCGCIRAETNKTRAISHGASIDGKLTGAYRSWLTMRRRCGDPSFKDYPRYGGVGIKVHPEWQRFENFLSDMGERPPGMTLDRENNSGHYEPTNCRWATHQTQMNNMSTNRVLHFQGHSHTVAEWARLLSIPRARISARLNKLKWPVEKALTP